MCCSQLQRVRVHLSTITTMVFVGAGVLCAEQILDHIDATLHGNSPVAFGLHPNAEIGFRTVSVVQDVFAGLRRTPGMGNRLKRSWHCARIGGVVFRTAIGHTQVPLVPREEHRMRAAKAGVTITIEIRYSPEIVTQHAVQCQASVTMAASMRLRGISFLKVIRELGWPHQSSETGHMDLAVHYDIVWTYLRGFQIRQVCSCLEALSSAGTVCHRFSSFRWKDLHLLMISSSLVQRLRYTVPRSDYLQKTSEQLLAAIVDLSPSDRPRLHGVVNGGVNFAEQTSQDILEVKH